jgi:hypothetical protein
MTTLLVAEPKEPDPREAAAFWRTACFMLAAFSLFIGGAIGFSLGNTFTRDAQQAEIDAEHYRDLAEGCAVAFNDLAFDATYAAHALLERAEYDRERFEYFDSLRAEPRVEYVAEVDD